MKPAEMPGLAPEGPEKIGRAILRRVAHEMRAGPLPLAQALGKYGKVLPGAVAVATLGAVVAGFFSRLKT